MRLPGASRGAVPSSQPPTNVPPTHTDGAVVRPVRRAISSAYPASNETISKGIFAFRSAAFARSEYL